MLTKIQNFFLKLQRGDRQTKQRWLVILTSGSMAIVIAVWAVYFNLTVQNLGQNQSQKPAEFLEVFKNGLRVVSSKIGSELSQTAANLQDLAQKTNSVTIQVDASNSVPAPDSDFQPKDLESVKPKKLP